MECVSAVRFEVKAGAVMVDGGIYFIAIFVCLKTYERWPFLWRLRAVTTHPIVQFKKIKKKNCKKV